MVKGYAPKYTSIYNTSAKPQFSVGECWDGYARVTSWINGTKDASGKIQSAAFDFPFRDILKTAIESSNWAKLNESMLATSTQYQRYAVTFVDNQSCSDDSSLHLVAWDCSLDMTDKDVGSLFAHTLASLLHSGEHGVAGYGTLTIGESADGNVVRHFETHALGGIHNAYGSVVVDGKECRYARRGGHRR